MSPLPLHTDPNPNLAINPSFEDPLASFTAVNGTALRTEDAHRLGRWGVQLTADGAGNPTLVDNNGFIPLTSGKRYYMEVYHRHTSVIRGIYFNPRFYSVADTYLGSALIHDGVENIRRTVPTSVTWNKSWCSFKFVPGSYGIPATATKMTLSATVNVSAPGPTAAIANGEVFHFDDVYIGQEVDEPATIETLTPGYLELGGVLELHQKIGPNSYKRLAFLADVTTGLKLKSSLQNMDTLEFAVPRNRFVPSIAAFLTTAHDAWTTSNQPARDDSPFEKGAAIRENLYLFYRTPDQERRFRIASLDYDDEENLSGQAISSGVLLSDYITQYVPGISQYAGALPSEIVERNFDGYQSLFITNRRFVRDKVPNLQLLNPIPDMTPPDVAVNAPIWGPLPFVHEITPVNPDDLDSFSGIPSYTVPPHGTQRALPTGNLAYIGFQDSYYPTLDKAYRRYGNFLRPYSSSPLPGPLNYAVPSGTAFRAGEQNKWTSRVIYGAIKTGPTAGVYVFQLTTGPKASRIWFQGVPVSPTFMMWTNTTTTQAYRWVSLLEPDTWYPLVIHHSHTTYASSLKLEWKQPGDPTYSILPATNLSPDICDNFSVVRFTDSMSVVRFMVCYKRWDGKALIMCYPLPASQFSPTLLNGADWPKAVPPGASVEEVIFPVNDDRALSLNWGSGWTRSSGARAVDGPTTESVMMQPRSVF